MTTMTREYAKWILDHADSFVSPPSYKIEDYEDLAQMAIYRLLGGEVRATVITKNLDGESDLVRLWVPGFWSDTSYLERERDYTNQVEIEIEIHPDAYRTLNKIVKLSKQSFSTVVSVLVSQYIIAKGPN